jgi:hypothetical protein
MSKVLVTESYLTDIGNAIRSKNGGNAKYKPSEMAGAINDITTQDNTVLNSILDRSISGGYVNDDLTEIGNYAFYGCENLTSATFTEVTKIDMSAFNGCTSLESISLPKVKEIEMNAFSYSGLKSISMPKIEVLGTDDEFWGIFYYCQMTTINIPSTIQSIGKNAFASSKITTINIDKPVNSISGAPWGATGATVYWQGKLAPYTTIDLNNGQWVDSGTTVDGHTVYQSDAGSYHTANGKSICTVTVSGYSKVTVHATNYSEAGYDYTEVGPLDGTVSRASSTNVLSTRFQNSKTDYKSYTFNMPDTNTHTFQILYSKDNSNDQNDDRGYFYIVAE